MFVVDFITASLLAVAFTVAFAALVRSRGYRRLGEMSSPEWLVSIASWTAGVLIVAAGPWLTGTHWIPFLLAVITLGVVVVFVMRRASFTRAVHRETGPPGTDARPAVAWYFVFTLLLFFCAISLRFYLAHLA